MHAVSVAERRVSAAVHVGSIFAPIWAPALVWILFRESPFIAGHARKALFDFLILKAALLIAGLVSLAYTAQRLWVLYQNDWHGFDLMEFVVRFAIGWLLLSVLGVLTTAISVFEAAGALRGRWPRGVRRAPATSQSA